MYVNVVNEYQKNSEKFARQSYTTPKTIKYERKENFSFSCI